MYCILYLILCSWLPCSKRKYPEICLRPDKKLILFFLFADLKKLIKYEQRKDLEVDESSDFSRFSEIFTYLYSTGTIASKAKETKKHENIITVEVKRPKKDRRILTDICLDKDNYCTSKINNKTAGNECQDTALEKEDKFMKSKSAGRTSARSGQSRVTIKPKASCKLQIVSKHYPNLLLSFSHKA